MGMRASSTLIFWVECASSPIRGLVKCWQLWAATERFKFGPKDTRFDHSLQLRFVLGALD